MLEKVDRVIMLKDFYGSLLTDRQQDVIHLYYENDWSLAEIAGSMNVSRQAVHDLLRRSEAALEDYEQRLGLMDKFLSNRARWQKIHALLSGEVDRHKLDMALSLLEELKERV
ncbi:MAG: YlxM family DNA-binding protein [Syntrophomonas sp.]